MVRNKKFCVVLGILAGMITITLFAVRKIESRKHCSMLENW